MSALNRRTLLKGSFALGAAGLFGSAHAAGAVKLPQKWDETVDVIVIGSGFAGLAAAIEAKKAGANTIVLEKMPTAGGNSVINGGILTATGCPQQKKHNIQDSPELLAKDILVAGLYMNQPEKVKLLADNALSNYEWTVNELGVEYNQDAIGQEGGHSVPRYVFTKNGSGSGIVSKEIAYLEKLGVKVRTRTLVEHIFRDDEGRVLGVEVREGYRFPKADSGKTKFIRATNGVVLCYGGFSRDVPYRMSSPTSSTARTSPAQPPNSGVKRAASAAPRSRTTGSSARLGTTRRKRAWASAGRLRSLALRNTASGSPRPASASSMNSPTARSAPTRSWSSRRTAIVRSPSARCPT